MSDTIHVEHYLPPGAYVGWYIASYNGRKATGASRVEAIGHLLQTLRNEVEVVSIELRPVKVGSRRGHASAEAWLQPAPQITAEVETPRIRTTESNVREGSVKKDAPARRGGRVRSGGRTE